MERKVGNFWDVSCLSTHTDTHIETRSATSGGNGYNTDPLWFCESQRLGLVESTYIVLDR